MKYLILMRGPAEDGQPPSTPDDLSEPESMEELDTWFEEVNRRGSWLVGERLRPDTEGKRVQLRGRHVRVTDGPFAEAKEHIGGFDVLECTSLEEAIEVASKHPFAAVGTIEVREAWPFD
ncbi:MAG: YciI family protein [Mycobacteriales bacterium]